MADLIIADNSTLKNGRTFWRTAISRSIAVKMGAEAQSFKEIFGDLSGAFFSESLDLSNLNLNSLKGCPKKIKGERFDISGNPNLQTLLNAPALDPHVEIFVDSSLLLETIRVCKICNNFGGQIVVTLNDNTTQSEFEDFLMSVILTIFRIDDKTVDPEKIASRIFYTAATKSPSNGYFLSIFKESKIVNLYFYGLYKKLYEIYNKVGNDRGKLNRALELL